MNQRTDYDCAVTRLAEAKIQYEAAILANQRQQAAAHRTIAAEMEAKMEFEAAAKLEQELRLSSCYTAYDPQVNYGS